MKKSRTGIIAVLVLMLVGFAAVSTTLIINGTAIFWTNTDDFEVIFTKSIIDGVDVTDTTISGDGKTLTFSTGKLAIKDDTSVLNFTVTNNSTQYDAKVAMECTAEGENVAEYYTITNTIPEVVTAKSSEDGSVTATLTKSSVENITETFTCTITATAMERTEIGKINNISAYYEYGLPTTLSSTDYTTLGYNVFARLGIDNSLTLCINDGELFCIKPNDYENSSLSLKTHFGEENCTIGFSNLSCSSESFYCDTYSDGFVSCRDNIANNSCYISNSGSVVCS